MTDPFPHVPLRFEPLTAAERLRQAQAFFQTMDRRRSVRFFTDEPVDRSLIELAIRTAGTAPSGAHRQPWRFVAISDPALKRAIREAAETEERETYETRMTDEWRAALAPLGTDWRKPFLETAPWIVVLFAETYGVQPDGGRVKNYYVAESVGIAAGLFIAALHTMGLATLTHTPNPMAFLSRLLNRPSNEKPYILFPVGLPAPDATVPDLLRKPLGELVQWNDGREENAE